MENDYKQDPATPNQKEQTTMPENKKAPSHKAFTVENYKKDGQEKAHWTEIGAAWQHKDGKGFDVVLKLMPLDGRIVIRESNKDAA